MELKISRRGILGGVATGGAVSLAGCGDTGPGRTSVGIFLTNETERTQTITLRVFDLLDDTDGGGETAGDTDETTIDELVVRRAELQPEDGFTIDGEELPVGRVRLRVLVRGGSDRSYDWQRRDERATIDVRVSESSIRFTELD